MANTMIFYLLQFIILASALGVVLIPNPVHCALLLATTMISIAALFFSMEAYFIAGVQLVVYAGAVMVLFVMVVMLFNLKKEKKAFSRGGISQAVKTLLSIFIFSLIAGGISLSFTDMGPNQLLQYESVMRSIKELAALLFTKYVFAFETLCMLLILVVVGAVSLARAKGGTHAD